MKNTFTEQDILDAVENTDMNVAVMKSLDDDYYRTTAQHWYKMFQTCCNVGFSKEQAITLIAASIGGNK